MTELFKIMGWSPPQWRKAIEYHDTLRPTEPFGRKIPDILDDIRYGRSKQWEDLQDFWSTRRTDQPLDVAIVSADGKSYAR